MNSPLKFVAERLKDFLNLPKLTQAMKRLHSDQKSSSAEAVASIDDLLLEILGRLRLKLLFRFKSVSKRWNSLASDPRLRKNQSPNPPVGLITPANLTGNNDDHFAYVVPFDESDPPNFLELPESANISPTKKITMLQSCNGLLICTGFGKGDRKRSEVIHFVFNPTTMKSRTLPKPTFFWGQKMRILDVCLAFDPSVSPHYKVVCITNHPSFQFQVYSSQTGYWRIITDTKEVSTHKLQTRDGVFWNGAVHWISNDPNFDSYCFNPDEVNGSEVLRVFPSPPGYVGYDYYFGESGGHLHYVDYTSKTGEVTVYEMRTDYSEWFVKFNFRVNVRCKDKFSVRYLVRAKKEEDSFVVLWDDGRIIRHYLLSETFETMNEMTLAGSKFMLPYFESICLV